GHAHIVVTVDVSADGQWIATGSKDHSVRVWRAPAATGSSAADEGTATAAEESICVATGEGHSDAVGAVRFSRAAPSAAGFWMVSGSSDRTLKVWDLVSLLSAAPSSSSAAAAALTPVFTKLAHEKDINCLAVSPNDKLIACGAQDKTITLWSTAP